MKKIVAAVLILAAGVAAGQTNDPGFPVRWTFGTQNMDGTPLTDLAGAKVYWGTQSSNYTQVIDLPGGTPGGTIEFWVRQSAHGIQPGVTYYLNGTAYNEAGLESDFTIEVSKRFEIRGRPKPVVLTATPTTTTWGWVKEKVGGVWQSVLKIIGGG